MVEYYKPVFDGSNFVSVDKIRLKLEFDNISLIEKLVDSVNNLMFDYLVDCLVVSYKDYKYRYLFTFKVAKYSFSLGLLLNHHVIDGAEARTGFFEFNPNKILGGLVLKDGILDEFESLSKYDSCPFVDDIAYDSKIRINEIFFKIFSLVKRYSNYTVKRYDLAIDIPVSRKEVHLFKDTRKYTQFYRSSYDFTEYLGSGQNSGRVKVYNKTLESDLEYDLTRFEITLEVLSYSSFLKVMPRVKVISKIKTDCKEVVLEMLEMLPVSDRNLILKKMSRPTRYKYEKMIGDDYLSISEVTFKKIVNQVFDLVYKEDFKRMNRREQEKVDALLAL